MRNSLALIAVLAAALAAAGCRSTQPKSFVVKTPASATNAPAAKPAVTGAPAASVAAPPAVAPVAPASPKPLSELAKAKAEETAAKEEASRMKAIEKTLAERRAEQDRIARQLEDLKKQIMDSAQSLRDLKLKTDTLSNIQATNAAGIASLEAQLAALQKPPAKAVQELQATLQKERSEREKAAAQLAEKNREIEALKKQKTVAAPATKPVAPPAATPAPAPAVVTAATPPPAAAAPAAVPPSAYKLVADGNELLRSGKVAEAEQAFMQALAQAPGLTGAKVGLAACRYNTGKLDDAMKLAGEVLAVDKRNAQALGIKGIALWQQGKLKEANQALNDAVRYDPSDSQLHNYLGVVLQSRDEPEDALAEMRKAVQLDGDNAEARYNLAVLLATGRKPAMYEARVHYEAALRLGNARDEAMDKLLYGATTATP